MSRKKIASVLAGAVLTGGCMLLAVRNVSFVELWKLLAGARLAWVAPLVAVSLVDLVIRAVRWRILLKKTADAPSPLLFRLQAIGIALNNILFMRLGELARAFLAARELDAPMMSVLATVAVERALDLAALLFLFCLASAAQPQFVPVTLRRGGLLALLGTILALTLLALAEGPLSSGGAWERRLRRVPALHKLIVQLATGAAALREPAAAAKAVGWSLLLWTIDASYYWFGARALGLGRFVDAARSALILSWAGAGAALPAAPGAFGTFEALVKSIMVAFGAPDSAAFGFAIFNHISNYVIVTGLGLAFLWKIELSIGELRSALARERSPQ